MFEKKINLRNQLTLTKLRLFPRKRLMISDHKLWYDAVGFVRLVEMSLGFARATPDETATARLRARGRQTGAARACARRRRSAGAASGPTAPVGARPAILAKFTAGPLSWRLHPIIALRSPVAIAACSEAFRKILVFLLKVNSPLLGVLFEFLF